jgi:hypothetical protein
MIHETEHNGSRLSARQRRLWLAGCTEAGPHCQLEAGWTGALDLARLDSALRELSRRHEGLRAEVRRVPGLRFPVLVAGGQGPPPRVIRASAPPGGESPSLECEVRAVDERRFTLRLRAPCLWADETSLALLCGELADLYFAGPGAPQELDR